MEQYTNTTSTICTSRNKFFFFLIGFCIVTVLTMTYTGSRSSFWNGAFDPKKTSLSQPPQDTTKPDNRIPAAYPNDNNNNNNNNNNHNNIAVSQPHRVSDWAASDEEAENQDFKEQKRSKIHFNQTADKFPSETHETPWLLDGTYREQSEGSESIMKRTMVQHRMADDFNYCSEIAKFVGPFSYVEVSKNPCWYAGGVLQCVPYFYLAGFSKSGTSDLFGRLSHHPQVAVSRKEKHWLDFLRYFKTLDSIEYYTSMFRKATNRIAKDIDENGSSQIVTGDGTPCYAWFNFYWRCYEGNQGLEAPRFTNADVLHRLNPKTKIIFLLREPASRLYSRYLTWVGRLQYKVYKEPSPQAFHSLVENAIKLFNHCVDRWSVRHCAFNGTLYTQMKLRLQEGLYSVFLHDWMRVFPKNQLLVLRFEDYVTDVPGALKKVFKFLDIEQLPSEKLDKIVNGRIRNSGRHYNVGHMLNATRILLQKFYSPFNEELPYLLNDPSMRWTSSL